ncbi:VCBS domain-containing protein [Xanthobacter sp. 126]|uniref:VCBS domain-containing protein n=1 Tax=Xanthobacter sp. 126 TaxID=1131814 RepID=UPI00045E5D1E|nr:VCBS domain-containing protein [Xanthobacter sp. 126]
MAAKAKTGFSGLDKSKTLAENTVNAGPVVLDSNVTFVAPANAAFMDASFTVSMANSTALDHFSISQVGGITFYENSDHTAEIYYNDFYIGRETTAGTDQSMNISLVQGVTGEEVSALARAISYSYSGDVPSTAARAVIFSFSSPGATSSATMQLKLKPEGDAPKFSNLSPTQAFRPAAATAGVVIDADAHVTNPDGTGFKNGKLSVHLAGGTSTDEFYLSAGAFSITGTKLYLDGKQVGTVSANGLSGHDLAFSLKSGISDAQMSALLDQVSYRSTSPTAPTSARDVTFTVTDADKGVASGHVSLSFENHAPTIGATSWAGDPVMLSATATGQPGSGASWTPVISPDGTKVAFLSGAANLVAVPAGGDFPSVFNQQVMIKDLVTGGVVVVSSDSQGRISNESSTGDIVFSPDGHKVAIVSLASNLIQGDTNGVADIFIKDLDTGSITRVSTDAQGGQGSSSSERPVFSPDGTKIAFQSYSPFVAGDTGHNDIFVKDLSTGAITRVSTYADGKEFGANSDDPVFSPDGTKIAFVATGSEAGPGAVGKSAYYIKDLVTGEIKFISYAGGSTPIAPVFSPDGTKLAFLSYVADPTVGSSHGSIQVLVKDLNTSDVAVASSSAQGVFGNDSSYGSMSFSGDGTKLAFGSDATNLVVGDDNQYMSVFVKDLNTGEIVRFGGDGESSCPVFTPDGRYIIFQSYASNIVAGDTNSSSDIFIASIGAPNVHGPVVIDQSGLKSLSTSGAIQFADADTSDTHTASVTSPADALGTLTAKIVSDANGAGVIQWSYSVDEAKVAPLAEGETRAETFVVKLTDASGAAVTQDVTITLVGTGGGAGPQVSALSFSAQPSVGTEGIVSDPFATLKAAASGAPDDLSAVFATLEARAAGLLEAASHAHGALAADHLPDLHLPAAVADYLDAIGSSLLDHAQSAHPALVHELSDRAEALAAHVHDVLHPVHGSADALI